MLIQKMQYLSDFIFELFPAFICANNIESLGNNFFGFKIFNAIPVAFPFCRNNFILSAIVFLALILSLLYHFLVVNHVHQNQELTFKVCLEHLSFSSNLLEVYHIELYIYLKASHLIQKLYYSQLFFLLTFIICLNFISIFTKCF